MSGAVKDARANRVVAGRDGKRHCASIRRRFVRCGDPSCSVCQVGPGHGPYLYQQWRDGDHVRENYLGRA